MSKTSMNAGVHTGTGIEFQKHCALYLLIENWETHKDKKYFICIEHHDDFLFCYQNEDELVETIQTYQAKKSSEPWGMTRKLYKILQQILEVGKNIKNDSIPKSPTYSHQLSFLTNNSIKIPKNTLNETNSSVKFVDLPEENRNTISQEIEKINPDLSEINNLNFYFIDIGKTSKNQKRQLIGLFTEIFNKKVSDHKAAVDVLLGLFRDIELTFNQGNKSKLLDESKRLDSKKINDALEVITTKSKAFDVWRDKKDDVSKLLRIPFSRQEEFELHFENSFDYFKDKTKTEHYKIFTLVKSYKSILDSCYSESECIESLYNKVIIDTSIRQDKLYVKAAILAAYFEIKDMQS
jgi:hypothetical protein